MPEFPPAPQQQNADLHYEGWVVLRTPLQHGGDQSLGTTRLFRSQKFICDDGTVRRIPIYSGNAIRGMLRDIAAGQLLEALRVQVPPHVFDFLTSGGSLTSGKQAYVDLGLARELRNTIPMIGLFGGGVGNQIIEGKTIFLQGTPICKETVHVLPAYCRDAPSAGLSVRDLRQMEFGTRRDDKKKEGNQKHLSEAVPERGSDDVATQMIYETETLAPGTCLRFGFIATAITPMEWKTLAMALVGFMRQPFLGARSSAGYGEISMPLLYRAKRQVNMLQAPDGIIDKDKPLATVESVVDREDRLSLVVEEIEREWSGDVEQRRQDIIKALGRVV